MRKYLIAYNLISGLLWILVLRQSFQNNYNNLLLVQSLSLVEVINSLLQITNSPLLTSVIQLLSRLLISYFLTTEPSLDPNLKGLLVLAWSVADCTRYFYYALKLTFVPYFFVVLRYSLFIVLYPVGALCEILVLWSIEASDSRWKILAMFYVPGFIFLYRHMLQQRKKYLK